MGNAVITQAMGSGLYKAQRTFETDHLTAEKNRMTALNDQYWRTLNDALDVVIALRKERAAAKETVTALIQQWIDVVRDKTKPIPPITPEEADEDGNDPVTGLPYTDDDRATALEQELLEKINTERIAQGLDPFSGFSTRLVTSVRNRLKDWSGPAVETLPDLQSDAYLQMLLRQKSISDEGARVQDRILSALPASLIDRADDAQAAGQQTSDEVIAAWKRDGDTWAGLMRPETTDIGLGYHYAPQFPATHMWSAVTAMILDSPDNTAFFANPAGSDLLDYVSDTLGPDAADAMEGGGETGGGQWIAESWSANTYYGIGATIMAKRTPANGGNELLAMTVGTSGLSGSTEPLWPGPGSGIGDYQLVWRVTADIPKPIADPVSAYYGWW